MISGPELLTGNIMGIVDAYGAVHSVFTGEELGYHESEWPNQTHSRWRWSHRHSINWLVAEHKLDDEQYVAVQNHLTRKYGLLWWENGHHDIDHLMTRS